MSSRVRDLSQGDPMAAFRSEHDGTVSRSTAALPRMDVDTFRHAPERSPRLTLAPPAKRRRRSRRAMRIAIAAAIVATAAAGAELYRPDWVARVADARVNGPLPPLFGDTNTDPTVAAAETPLNAPPASETTPDSPPAATDPPAPTGTSAAGPSSSRAPIPAQSNPAPPAPAATPVPDAEVAQVSPGAAAPEAAAPLSGEWVMNTRVESSRLKEYEGLRLAYRVRLQQDGNRISGTGWKISEDDRALAAPAQTPITFDGVMNGDRIELTFTERGQLRVSAGKLVLARNSDDVLQGRFSTNAADSVGVVEIHREARQGIVRDLYQPDVRVSLDLLDDDLRGRQREAR